MYVDGRFYKGGQFIPQSAAGGGSAGMFMDSGSNYTPDLPAPRRKARTTARTAARTEYRGEAKPGTAGGTSPEAIANSRLQMARNLIGLGKTEAARGWLLKVVEADASATTAEEARRLLADIEGRKGPSKTKSALGVQSRATPSASIPNPGPVARSALPRYFAQTTTNGSIRYRQLSGPIGVLESRDGVSPIGTASEDGSNAGGLARWRLVVHGTAAPGRFVITDREFKEDAK